MNSAFRHPPRNMYTRKSKLMTIYKQLNEVKKKQILLKEIKKKLIPLLTNLKEIKVVVMISLRVPPQTLAHRMRTLLIQLLS